MYNQTRLGIAVLLIWSAACRPAPRSETTSMGGTSEMKAAELSAADKAAVRDLGTKWAQAATAGDANALSALYTADATLLPDAAPAVKGDAVKNYWTGFTKNFSGRAELNTTSVEGRGDLAYAVGTFRLTPTPKGGGKPSGAIDGKWVTVQKKQSDGSWKLVADIWNLNAPPPK
jgi:uncharacterized protein (TIGR02246 family)